MKILVACEESQAVTKELRNRGHEAYSCDIEPCTGGHPEWHIQQDVIPLLNGRCTFKKCDGTIHNIIDAWDMIIAFPPCTYISGAGNAWLNIEKYGERAIQRYKDREKGAEFFMKIANADCERIAIENPVGYMNTHFRKPDQIFHPYHFGDSYEKRTCLWLKGLPALKHTNIVTPPERMRYKSGKTAAAWFAEAVRLPPKERARVRSKTFPGVAKAMAEQWTNTINKV